MRRAEKTRLWKWKKTGRITMVCLTLALALWGCKNHEKERQELRLQGIRQLEEGDYEGAIESLEQALQNSNGFVGEFELDILKYRAQAEYEAGDYDASAYTYEVLLQVDEENEEYRVRMCSLQIMAGELDKAKEGYGKLYESSPAAPSTAQVLLLLGQALMDGGRSEEALELYLQAMNGGMESGEIYNRMALCQLEEGDVDRAIQYLEQGLATGDAQAKPALMLNQAAVYEKKLDFTRALEILRQYAAAYGGTPEIEKEIEFLKSR
ncbi:MAG: tetratricopeptide repeat protein [Hungatella sp.]|nr:tetratricopeptide repeat protein [Hungatella sp.]